MKTYIVWQHKNGRTYRRRIQPGADWKVPKGCVSFKTVVEEVWPR